MTKKDFQLIAATIAALTDSGGCQNSIEADILRADVARAFADALAPTNPRFKRDLFIQAATGAVAVTARKAKPALDCDTDTAWNRAMREHNAPTRTLASDIAEDR